MIVDNFKDALAAIREFFVNNPEGKLEITEGPRRLTYSVSEARKQLCKMQGEMAGRMGLNTLCICTGYEHEVPVEVITEMWALVSGFQRKPCKMEDLTGKADPNEEIFVEGAKSFGRKVQLTPEALLRPIAHKIVQNMLRRFNRLEVFDDAMSVYRDSGEMREKIVPELTNIVLEDLKDALWL